VSQLSHMMGKWMLQQLALQLHFPFKGQVSEHVFLIVKVQWLQAFASSKLVQCQLPFTHRSVSCCDLHCYCSCEKSKGRFSFSFLLISVCLNLLSLQTSILCFLLLW